MAKDKWRTFGLFGTLRKNFIRKFHNFFKVEFNFSLQLSVILRSFRLTKAGFVYIIIIVNMAVIREYCL